MGAAAVLRAEQAAQENYASEGNNSLTINLSSVHFRPTFPQWHVFSCGRGLLRLRAWPLLRWTWVDSYFSRQGTPTPVEVAVTGTHDVRHVHILVFVFRCLF